MATKININRLDEIHTEMENLLREANDMSISIEQIEDFIYGGGASKDDIARIIDQVKMRCEDQFQEHAPSGTELQTIEALDNASILYTKSNLI